MQIVDLDEADSYRNKLVYNEEQEAKRISVRKDMGTGNLDTKRALVLAAARVLFYPTLCYNLFRNKIQPQFRWWDLVDQYILLGAVPFPKDVPRLKQLGVGGVITLNEPYETLVPTSLYQVHGIEHLVIPTRDYLFAPSFCDINRAVKFIHKNASRGMITYVHCKAGRGRSTTIVLCYLVEHRNMTPVDALEYVRSIRPRILLAPCQWKAVQEYGRRQVDRIPCDSPLIDAISNSPSRDAVLITNADLEGYQSSCDDGIVRNGLGIVPSRTRPMMAKLSCFFASLTTSGACASVSRQLTETPAC